MSHYEQRLEHDLQQIRQEVRLLAAMVETAVKNAAHALLTGNRDLASATILADGHINRAMRRIDGLCHSFIAVHLPSAGHLRLVSSIFRANILLERIGDYAVTMCRELFQLSTPPEGKVAGDIELMAAEARNVLRQAVRAFEEGNVELARGTMAMASDVQVTFANIFDALLQSQQPLPMSDKFAVFVVYHRLERIADQAKNLCEEAVFQATGQSKQKKVYRILFLDQDNSCFAPMAVAIARHSYPQSGDYSSAGIDAAGQLQIDMVEYMKGRGVDIGADAPVKFDYTPAELAGFHIIVGLQGVASKLIERPPFHTVLLNWNISLMESMTRPEALEASHRQLGVLIKDLLVELRGEDAS